jgi:voltage-dependent potassium channel beta subunit
MEYRFLGNSGLKVSALSYGSWVTFGDQIDTEQAAECMQIAHDHGVNFFDNAEAYANGQSERMMGQIIRDKGWTRSDLVVSTKIFWGGDGPNDRGLSRKHVVEGTTAALERLQMDYVDLVFCHRPDAGTPMEETVRAMSYLVEHGYAFYWGTSEWSAEQIRHAHAVARREHLVPPTMEQPQYNMFHRERVEREYAPLYDTPGLGTTIWSPLASGLLTGKYNDGIPDGSRLATEGYEWLQDQVLREERLDTVRRLTEVAKDLGCTTAQLALAWCLLSDRVSTVITGASKPAQVRENMQALGVVEKIDGEAEARIESILDNEPGSAPNFRDQ